MSSVAPVTAANASDQPPSTQPTTITPQLGPIPVGRTDTPSTLSLRSNLSWQSVRSSLSLSEKTSANLGWAIGLLSVIFTVVALSPTFRSQSMSEKSLQLAEWTALKDFIEECREELAAGIQNQACLKAMKAQLPPPPYVKAGILDKKKRYLLYRQFEHNGSDPTLQAQYPGVGISGVLHWTVWLSILLMIYCFITMCRYINQQVDRRAALMRQLSVKGEEESVDSDRPTPEPELVKATIRHPPSSVQSSLRRRVIRTHPVYRHGNLEEAIHHQDLAEIRLRLVNGDDVNQHWPYLIYKLAISPPSVDTPKHLEIARMCLDFGADVNALKGWNGQSALMIAIHFGNLDVAKLLIVNGAMVSYSPPDSNLTALHRCVRLAVTGSAADALEIMELLFQFNADPNQADRGGETPLHKLLIDAWLKRDNAACMEKIAAVALCLVEHGAYMPKTLKEKYIVDNPVWQVVQRAMLKANGPERSNEAIVAEDVSVHELEPRWVY